MAILIAALALAAASPRLLVFPLPNQVRSIGGAISISGYRILSDASLSGEAVTAREDLPLGGNRPEEVRLHLNIKMPSLGQEGYHLRATKAQILIESPTRAGLFYGVQTLRQMTTRTASGWLVPSVDVVDQPRFGWRGMMLDTSRHFFPKKDILHMLDLLSQYKINSFHWHLVDDGGWRIQIKKYPNLTDRGAWRIPTDGRFPEYKGLDFPPRRPNDHHYGGFYTQDDVREIVKYATKRHVNIVPEIEMPGHNLAATIAYPWLICSKDLKPGFQKETDFVFPNIFCAGKESTYKFVEDVLTEVMALFPSPVIHIGGDEVDKYLWSRCDDCKATMTKEHLASPAELESYFVRRVEKFVNARGRHIIGWDEILEGGLAPNAYVMSWRGEAGGIEAAKQHHKVVMTPWDQCYFDHDNTELPIEVALGYDPAPVSGGPNLAKYVMGAQASIWTETLPFERNIEDRLFPRILALSQSLWRVPRESESSFLDRLDLATGDLFRKIPGMHLRGPRVDQTVVLPGEQVILKEMPIGGLKLRYTLDGTRPNTTSSKWPGKLSLTKGQVLTAGYVGANGFASEATQINCAKIQPAAVANVQPGLTYAYFAGSFKSVPAFAGLSPARSGEHPVIGLFAEDKEKEHYALDFKGYLRIDRAGTYRISTLSDDGSVLWLDGAKIVDNDGFHGRREQTATLKLEPGLYPLEVGYFQFTEGASLDVMISGPGIPKQKLGKGLLFH